LRQPVPSNDATSSIAAANGLNHDDRLKIWQRAI